MKNVTIKACLAFIISTLFVSIVYASNHIEYLAKPKQYVIRITSEDASFPIAFTGSYYTSSSVGSKLVRVDKVTPFEVVEKANSLAFMFSALNDHTGLFKVMILEKDASGEHQRLLSKSQSQYGMISTDGMAMIGE